MRYKCVATIIPLKGRGAVIYFFAPLCSRSIVHLPTEGIPFRRDLMSISLRKAAKNDTVTMWSISNYNAQLHTNPVLYTISTVLEKKKNK